jgi:hypothetical protein
MSRLHASITSAPSATGSTKQAVVNSAMLTEEPRVDDTMRRHVALFSKIHDCARARRGVGVRHAAQPLRAAGCGGLTSARQF